MRKDCGLAWNLHFELLACTGKPLLYVGARLEWRKNSLWKRIMIVCRAVLGCPSSATLGPESTCRAILGRPSSATPAPAPRECCSGGCNKDGSASYTMRLSNLTVTSQAAYQENI